MMNNTLTVLAEITSKLPEDVALVDRARLASLRLEREAYRQALEEILETRAGLGSFNLLPPSLDKQISRAADVLSRHRKNRRMVSPTKQREI